MASNILESDVSKYLEWYLEKIKILEPLQVDHKTYILFFPNSTTMKKTFTVNSNNLFIKQGVK